MLGVMNRYSRICAETNLNAPKVIAVATTLAVHEQFVIVNSGGAINVTMPSVAEAMGHEYVIWLRTDGGDVTVVAPDAIGFANLVLGDVGDVVHLKSNGVSWDVWKQGVA